MTGGLTGTMTVAEFAAVVERTPERIRQLISADHLPRPTGGRLPVGETVRMYARHLRDERAATSVSVAEDRVRNARAQEIELRIAREDGQLIELAEHDAIFDEAFGVLSSRLFGVPAEVTRDLDLRRLIEGKIDAALTACSEVFAKAVEAA